MKNEIIRPNRFERFIANYPGSLMMICMAVVFALTGILFVNFPSQANTNAGFTARNDIFQQKSDAYKQALSAAAKEQEPRVFQTQEADLNTVYILYEATDGNMASRANLELVRNFESKVLDIDGMSEHCQLLYKNGESRCKPMSTLLNHLLINTSRHHEDCLQGWCNTAAAYLGGYQDSFDTAISADTSFDAAATAAQIAGRMAAGMLLNSCPSFVPVNPGHTSPSDWGDMPCDSTDADFSSASDQPMPDPDAAFLQDIAQASVCDGSTDPFRVLKTGYRSLYLSRDFSCESRQSKFMRSMVYFGGPYGPASNGTIADEVYDVHNEWLLGTFLPAVDALIVDFNHHQINSPVRIFFSDTNRKVSAAVMNQGMLTDGLLISGSFAFVFAYMWLSVQSVFLAAAGMLEIVISMPLALFCWSVIGQQKHYNTLMLLGLFIILGIGADDVFVFTDAWHQSSAQAKHISGSVETRLAWSYRRAFKAMSVTSTTTFFAFGASAFTPVPIMLSFGVFAALLVLFDFLLVITWYPACVIFHHRYLLPRVKGLCGCCWCCCVPAQPRDEEGKEDTEDDADQAEDGVHHIDTDRLRPMEQFFYFKYSNFMAQKKVRLPIIAFFLLLTVVGATVAGLYLRPSEENLTMFHSPEHKVSKLSDIATDEFVREEDDRKITVDVVWGIPDVDPIDRTGVDMQESDEVGAPRFDDSFDLNTDDSQLEVIAVCEAGRASIELVARGENQPAQLYCFMEVFRDYVQHTNRTFPVGSLFVPQATEPGFEQYIREQGLKGTNRRAFSKTSWFLLNDDQTRVKLAWVAFNSTLPSKPLSYAVGSRWMAKWDDILAPTPGGLTTKFHTCRMWSWTITQKYLLSSATSGAGISFGLCYVVLLVSSGNWLISSLAMLAIAGAVANVFMLMVLAGWSIGVLESICMIIVVGMSVDYTVHLIHAYNESNDSTRFEKTRTALMEMGVSVLGGAITTFGASIFLFAAQMTFFFQFGLFIGFTIGLSCLFSMFFLIALLLTVGPEGSRVRGESVMGDIPFLMNRPSAKVAPL